MRVQVKEFINMCKKIIQKEKEIDHLRDKCVEIWNNKLTEEEMKDVGKITSEAGI